MIYFFFRSIAVYQCLKGFFSILNVLHFTFYFFRIFSTYYLYLSIASIHNVAQ